MIDITIEEKMRLTINLAQKALEDGEIPVAAVIFLGDDIISKSYVSEKAEKKYLAHAEIKALISADTIGFSFSERKQMQLFTTLEPCMMCLGAAMSFCIGEIYYSLEAPLDGAVELAMQKWKTENKEYPGYKMPEVYGGILRNEGKSLFVEYVKRNEKAPMFVKNLSSL